MLQVTSGNRGLKSEEGKTWTVGTVIRSPFEQPLLAGAALSIDWYKATITDAITQISAQTTYDLCFNRDGTSNPTYSIDDPNGVCRNITRDAATGVAQSVNSTYANTGTIATSGVDINASWRATLADMGLGSLPGALSINMSFTKVFNFEAQDFKGGAVLENVGTLARGGLFDWRSVTTVRYSNTNWDVGLNWRHLPSILSSNYVTDPATTVQGAGSYDIYGLTGNWNLTKALAISGGVDNLFDRQPERIGAGQVINIAASQGGGSTITNGAGSTNAGYYDVLGRRYFVNLKLRF
jgi:outer membrane receptor protein involved in Fe transport